MEPCADWLFSYKTVVLIELCDKRTMDELVAALLTWEVCRSVPSSSKKSWRAVSTTPTLRSVPVSHATQISRPLYRCSRMKAMDVGNTRFEKSDCPFLPKVTGMCFFKRVSSFCASDRVRIKKATSLLLWSNEVGEMSAIVQRRRRPLVLSTEVGRATFTVGNADSCCTKRRTTSGSLLRFAPRSSSWCFQNIAGVKPWY